MHNQLRPTDRLHAMSFYSTLKLLTTIACKPESTFLLCRLLYWLDGFLCRRLMCRLSCFFRRGLRRSLLCCGFLSWNRRFFCGFGVRWLFCLLRGCYLLCCGRRGRWLSGFLFRWLGRGYWLLF